MKIYDITQELFSCVVYPGDPAPQRQILNDMHRGDLYNLTAFSMCAHNGTHVDAPYHFIQDGKTVDRLPLETFVGDCFVAHFRGEVTAAAARQILEKAGAARRILIAGDAVVTLAAAEVFSQSDICLLGNESQTVGPPEAPMQVHKLLLGKGIAFLEGVVLKDVPEGSYFLSAAPLNISGADGAPCRAYLIEL